MIVGMSGWPLNTEHRSIESRERAPIVTPAV